MGRSSYFSDARLLPSLPLPHVSPSVQNNHATLVPCSVAILAAYGKHTSDLGEPPFCVLPNVKRSNRRAHFLFSVQRHHSWFFFNLLVQFLTSLLVCGCTCLGRQVYKYSFHSSEGNVTALLFLHVGVHCLVHSAASNLVQQTCTECISHLLSIKL